MEKSQPKQVKIRTIRLKPSFLLLLVVVCVLVLAALIIPQRIRIREAQDELAEKQQELAQIKFEYAISTICGPMNTKCSRG